MHMSWPHTLRIMGNDWRFCMPLSRSIPQLRLAQRSVMNYPIRTVPRGPRPRSDRERLAAYVRVTVRRARTTTINVRHGPVRCAATQRHRAPPVFRRSRRTGKPARDQPGARGPLRPAPFDSPDSP
jgi:hypothetical protein